MLSLRAKTGLGAKSLGMLNESKRAAADSFYRQASATVIPNRPGHRSGHEGVVLTTRQQKILEFIHAYTAERGFGPSIRDIGEAVGLSSSSTVHAHLCTLQRVGFLALDPSKPRGRTLTTDALVHLGVPPVDRSLVLSAARLVSLLGAEEAPDVEALDEAVASVTLALGGRERVAALLAEAEEVSRG